jgi:hypothetical protein
MTPRTFCYPGSSGHGLSRALLDSPPLGFSRWLSRIAFVLLLSASALVAQDLPSVQLNADNGTGKQLEDLTRKAVARDYAKAWSTLAKAMDSNNADLIDGDFVGVAADKFTSGIEQQAKAGLHRRYVDHGHKVDVLFYSPDGTSMQLRDTAQLEIQLMDGDKVLHRDNVTRQYISLMTPTEVRWKVRVLQEAEK